MGVILSDQKDKKAFYRKEASDLRHQANRVREEAGDKVKAGRLEKLATEADQAADAIENQLDDIAEKVSQ